MRYLLSAINAKYIHSNPGVYSLKEYSMDKCNKEGLIPPSIKILEHTINNQVDEILEDIYQEKPDFIGFSCYIWNIHYVDKLIVELHKLLPHTKIWVGGPEVSYRALEYLNLMPMVDGVICGEGEETFYQLIKSYEDNTKNDLSNIKGIFYRDGRSITDNGFATPIDINTIPFLYNSLDNFENRIIYYESSRGCPFSCSYCLSSIDKHIRYRDIELVKEELLFFLNNKVPQVKFIDRTFNCNPNRATDIWRFIHENDNNITNFHFEIAGDLLTEEQIQLVSTFRPGLIQFEIGVQSTNETTLKEIRRVSNLDKLSSNVTMVRKQGNIHQHLDLIAGLPYEDITSFKNSFNQVYAMRPDQLQLGFLKILSGSYMNEQTIEYQIDYRSYPPYEVLSTKWLSHDDILTLKHIENVVEIYYNSGQFTTTMEYLLTYFDSAYDMYHSLGEYYYTHYDTKAKHSRISRYYLLLDFFNNKVCDSIISFDTPEKFKQILTYDIYLRENIKTRPGFAKDLTNYHKTITDLKKENDLPNKAHIEVFTEEGHDIFVYFDYENCHPLTKSAKVIKLV